MAFTLSPGIEWYIVDAAYELQTPNRYRIKLKVVIQLSDTLPFMRKYMHTTRLMISPSPWVVLLRISSGREYVFCRFIEANLVKKSVIDSHRGGPLHKN